MISSISFENFRGFQSIELSQLSPITLISGKNNTGKSSILEGIFLFLDYNDPGVFDKLARFRREVPKRHTVRLWENLFYFLDSSKDMKLSVNLLEENAQLIYKQDTTFIPYNNDNLPQDIMNTFVSYAKSAYTLKYNLTYGDYQEEGHFSTGQHGTIRNTIDPVVSTPIIEKCNVRFINSEVINEDQTIVEWIGKLELQGQKQEIIQTLQLLEPNISDISTIAIDGSVQLYIKNSNKILPLHLAGDGMKRLLYLILSIKETPNSVILIDEIETGFHYSMYEKLWKILAQTAKEANCQIIATTHSYECIQKAIDGVKAANCEKDFCYYRMDQCGEKTVAHHYSADLLRSALEAEMEVR